MLTVGSGESRCGAGQAAKCRGYQGHTIATVPRHPPPTPLPLSCCRFSLMLQLHRCRWSALTFLIPAPGASQVHSGNLQILPASPGPYHSSIAPTLAKAFITSQLHLLNFFLVNWIITRNHLLRI